MDQETKHHHWSFQRVGGLDQVILSSEDDIRNLSHLDPKLWVALSCPTTGLEFDERTLALLDADTDGHIRIPEVIDAVNWTCDRLNGVNGLMQGVAYLPLNVIATETKEGKKLIATAQAVLKEYGKADATYVTQEDMALVRQQISQEVFNGDGVFPPLPALDEEMRLFVQDALSVMGGVADVSAKPGVNGDIARAFVQTLQDWSNWHQGLGDATSVFGENTSQAWGLMLTLKDKIDDYFLRTDLAGYAPQAQTALNVDEKFLVPAQNGLLESRALAELPLSKIETTQPLNLTSGLNPVWREQMEHFARLVQPLLAQPGAMTRQEWHSIQKALESYAQAIASQPALVKVEVTSLPTATVDQLSAERIHAVLQGGVLKRFEAMLEKDAQTPVSAADIAALEKLVVYYKHLYRLLLNFVSFKDFFDLQSPAPAAFQAGKLYINGFCSHLCVPVADVGQHTVLADYAELFLLYCECTRKNTEHAEKQKMTIAAAVTAGQAELLVEGRNGVFIDNHGKDWDAKVIKVIVKPISLRQAIWAPYRRIGKFISSQMNKWAASKDAAVTEAGMNEVQAAGANVSSPPAQPAPTPDAAAPKFDIGRNVGIFAAIGLALGALGTALASITRALFDLQWWQFPLVLLALFLIISGPSMLLAWLKLRQRTLGPLLEASGWAINGRVKINHLLGGELTSLAALPPGAKRNTADPLQDKSRAGLWIFLMAVLVGALAVGGWLWHERLISEKQKAPQIDPVSQTAPVPAPANAQKTP